jgi:hypothetical protein
VSSASSAQSVLLTQSEPSDDHRPLFLRAGEDAPKRANFFRAGNDVECETCGQKYADHVQDPIDPWLTVLYSGERVRL